MGTPYISVVMSYHNRANLLRTTLESYDYFYGGIRDKTEYIDRRTKYPRNPCVPYNMAAKMARGHYLNLTNPENAHMGPIISDSLNRAGEKKYLVYGCLNLRGVPSDYYDLRNNLGVYVDPDPRNAWYQHSLTRNRLLHFCSVISRKEFLSFGGFDELLADGSGYDDNDLIQTVVDADFEIETIDSLYCAHQAHSRDWDQQSTMDNFKLIKEKWGFFPIESWIVGKEKSQLMEARKKSGTFLFSIITN